MHPYLLHSGHLFLPTFGALAAVGLMLGLILSEKTARLARVSPDSVWNAGMFAVLAAFLLSRVLLIVSNFASFQAFPLLLLAVPNLTPAGLLLTAIVTGLWLRWKSLPIPRTLDAWAPCATLLWAFLALGHFFEGSDPGLSTRLPWGLRLPGESLALHPIALYAALLAAALTVWLYILLTRPHRNGAIVAEAFFLAGLSQYLLSFLRQPGEPSLGGLDMLQLVALAMLVCGLAVLIAFRLQTFYPTPPSPEPADAL